MKLQGGAGCRWPGVVSGREHSLHMLSLCPVLQAATVENLFIISNVVIS